jgi:molybdopterin/thiamine biosynthesis adenylyltransferase
VVQQLAHLGIRNLVLVEDDRVEESNLARLAGATWWDAPLRRKKTAVARRLVRRLAPGTQIRPTGSLRRRDSLEALATVDLIVGCVDNDGARLILSELAAAHLVPYLDIGVGIEGEERPKSIGGRIAFYLPGGPCLACADEIDFADASEDLETEALRKIRVARGYASDRRVEPALMPLNTVLVGLAMTELLAFATGVRPVIPFCRYDALEDRLVPQHVLWEEECSVCRPAFGMGDRQRVERYALE